MCCSRTWTGGPADFGSEVLPANDDGSSSVVDITPAFPDGLRFFTATHRSLFVNNNGNVTFGGPLSQFVSQQEYSQLLAADGVGGSLITLWRDDGYLDVIGSAYGTRNRLSGGIDIRYHEDEGIQLDSETERTEVYG